MAAAPQTHTVQILSAVCSALGLESPAALEGKTFAALAAATDNADAALAKISVALGAQAGIVVPPADLAKADAAVPTFAVETLTPKMLHEETDAVVAAVMAAAKPAEAVTEAAVPTAYFVTGATGFLGGWVAHLIATQRDADATVYILSRRDAAATRAVFEAKGLTFPKNAIVVQGDIGAANFGLNDATVAELRRTVKHWIHCAAHVVFGSKYADARPVTVMGAKHLLDLYSAAHPAAELHYISTNGVYPPYLTQSTGKAALESQDDFDVYAARLKEGYGWSKWIAEKAVMDVCAKLGRGVRVYRPGNIGWATDGKVNPIDFQTLIIFACRALSAAPLVATWNFEMTPVDLLAGFLLDKCGKVGAERSVHNVIGRRAPMDFYVIPTLARVPMAEWIAMAKAYLAVAANKTADPRAFDAVEQTLASFEEYVTLDMYLSDTNDYFTHNSLAVEPTRAYADAI